MSAALDNIFASVIADPPDDELPTVLRENWPCLTQDEKGLVGVLVGGGSSEPPPVPAPGVVMIAPPITGIADPRGVIGDLIYDPLFPMYLYQKVSIAPHLWVVHNVGTALP